MNQSTPPQIIEDDEINLTDLANRLAVWTHRRYVILRFSLLALMVLVASAAIGLLIIKPPLMNYATVITFSFPQAAEGRYPNGSRFSIADITNNNVMQAVWRNNQLETLGVSLREFTNAVSISQYADTERFIRSRYEGMLARRNLSQTEIATIEREFRTELEANIRRQARLSLTSAYNSNLSGDLANKLLLDIMTEWSTQAIRELGVTSIPVADIEVFNTTILDRGSPFQVIDYFYRSIGNLNQSVARIAEFPGGDTLRDPQSGRSLEDLKKRIRDISRYWILEFDNFALDNFAATEIEIRSAQTRLIEMELSRDILLKEAETLREALIDYDAIRHRDSLPVGTGFEQRSANNNGLQLEGDAIQRLINLGSQNKDAEYRQKLTDQRVTAQLRAAAMQEEIDRLSRRIQAAQTSAVHIQGNTTQLAAYTQDIVLQIRDIADALQRIQSVQMGKFMDDSGLLYRASGVLSQPATNLSRWFGVPFGIIVFLSILLLFVRALHKHGRKHMQSMGD